MRTTTVHGLCQPPGIAVWRTHCQRNRCQYSMRWAKPLTNFIYQQTPSSIVSLVAFSPLQACAYASRGWCSRPHPTGAHAAVEATECHACATAATWAGISHGLSCGASLSSWAASPSPRTNTLPPRWLPSSWGLGHVAPSSPLQRSAARYATGCVLELLLETSRQLATVQTAPQQLSSPVARLTHLWHLRMSCGRPRADSQAWWRQVTAVVSTCIDGVF